MIDFLKRLGASKKGAAAILGLGGPIAAGAILYEAVPHDSSEAKAAVGAVVVLLGVVGLLAGPKVAEKFAAMFAPKAEETGK